MKFIAALATILVLLISIKAYCQTIPEVPINTYVSVNNGVVYVEWQISGPVTSFEITAICVQGNTERRLSPATVYNRFAVYSEADLKQTANTLFGTTGPAKYRFAIRTLYNTLYSTETKTRTIQVK